MRRTTCRAGLFIVFLITFLFTCAAAAPIHAKRTSSSISSSHLSGASGRSIIRHIPNLDDSRVEHATAYAVSGSENIAARDSVVLVRRKSIFTKIKDGFKKLGHAIKHVAQKVGHGIKKVAQKVGHGIKKVAQKVGHGIKKAAQKVGHGIKTAAKKVGHFVKTTGAKIAKVGLKIAATVEKVASKVVSFVPGVGRVLGKAMEGISAGENAASNAIHAKIGGKLGKAMKGMDKAQKITGYIPR